MPKMEIPKGMQSTVPSRERPPKPRLKVKQPSADELDLQKLEERRQTLEETQEAKGKKLSKVKESLRRMKQNLQSDKTRFDALVRKSHEEDQEMSAGGYIDKAMKSSPSPEKLTDLKRKIENLEIRKGLFEQELREIGVELGDVRDLMFEAGLREDIERFAKDFKRFQDSATSLADAYDQFIKPQAAALKEKANVKKSGPRMGWTQRLINAGLSLYEVEALSRVLSGGYTGEREFVEYLSWLRQWNRPENPFYSAKGVGILSRHGEIGYGEPSTPAEPDAGADQVADAIAEAILEG